jgi:hypothetical protein
MAIGPGKISIEIKAQYKNDFKKRIICMNKEIRKL